MLAILYFRVKVPKGCTAAEKGVRQHLRMFPGAYSRFGLVHCRDQPCLQPPKPLRQTLFLFCNF